MSLTTVQELISALDVFSRTPDKASLDRANAWLQDFQHSPEAWSTCNVLLLAPSDFPPAAKLFAAQTFRAKVTYDLHQVDAPNLLPLRDSLLAALAKYHPGPRAIVTQLCLALAGLALQLPAWENPVQDMISSFGHNPAAVPTLLQFLQILPEEINSNTRIPITDEEYRERASSLLSANVENVLELLSMYIQAPGATHHVQSQVFSCLRTWIVAGEVPISSLAKTRLFECAFEALASEELFDSAVDVICEMIHETQEIDDNMPVIELIVPRVIALRPQLSAQSEDPDKIRGYARIFSEAGETYRILLLHHTETFFPIVEAIGECSAYSDLDVVPITFPFWMRLAQLIGKKPSVSPLFMDAYKSLMQVIIRHLHFPPDTEKHLGQEAEAFRSFRHVMGDTLKDCCYVLGTDVCLLATYHMITAALSQSPESVSWQAIEAPLFALRSVGAEIDPLNTGAVPKIMDLIPSLPNHPRIRYAAVLVISRYSEWINMHPEYIQFTLTYVSTGFEGTDSDISAAAGQALKYLCQDCKRHLSDFLPTLHTFLSTSGTKLVQEDRRQVYEAIAFVISAMPMERAAESLRTFTMDILSEVHALVSSATATKQDVQKVYDGLENLETMLHVIRSFGEDLPPACQNSCSETWAIFDSLLSKYGSDYGIAERVTRVLRGGLTLFGESALPVAPKCVERMSLGFEATGFSSYLWIAGKIVGIFGNEDNPALRASFGEIFLRSTSRILVYLQNSTPRDIPDVLEDYLQMELQMLDMAPDVFFPSAAFPVAFKASMAALTLVHSDVVFAALELFNKILTHDCLLPISTAPPPNFVTYAAAIKSIIEKEGFEFVGYLLSGLVGDFPEESTSLVVTMFKTLATYWSTQLMSWIPPVLEQLPPTSVPNATKAQFLSDMTSAVTSAQYEKVKYAIVSLHRASRKARDRRRAGPIDN